MRKVHGVGINDSNTPIYRREAGRQVKCKYYQVWTGMLERGYCKIYKAKHPAYLEVSVCPDWLLFSNFREWMREQDWKGNQLDKDLLSPGNKIYSPESCCFVTPEVNKFLIYKKRTDELPRGVTWKPKNRKYVAQCSDNGVTKYLGIFETAEQAHIVWKEEKLRLAKLLSEKQTDQRIGEAILVYYA